MGAEPTTVDVVATDVYKTVGDTVDAAQALAEAAIIAQVPLLGFPVIKQLWEGLFSYIMGKLKESLGDAAGFAVMSFQVSAEVSALINATNALKAAQAGQDQNAINQARIAADAAAASLLHFDGAISQ